MDKRVNQLSTLDMDQNRLAVEEVRNHIEQNSTRNLPITVKSVLTKFSNAPYGWKEIDIQGIIVTLFKNQDIKVIYNSEVLSPNNRDVVLCVTKKDRVERVNLKIREKVPNKYVDNLKDINSELFGFSSMPSDEDGMMNLFKDQCKTELNKIDAMLSCFGIMSYYPGEKTLKKGKRLFEEILSIGDTLEFFKTVYELDDDFADYIEDIEDIKKFFFNKENGRIDTNTNKGEQRKIFDDAIRTVDNYKINEAFIVDEDVDSIIKSIEVILRMAKPYGKIKDIPVLIGKYNDKIVELLEIKSEPVIDFIEGCKKEVLETLDNEEVKEKFSNKILEEFNSQIEKVEHSKSFMELSSMKEPAENLRLKWIQKIITENEVIKRREERKLSELTSTRGVGEEEPKNSYGNDNEVPVDKVKPVEIIQVKTKAVSVRELVKGEKIIKNEADIDAVIESLRRKLKNELEENTIINLI